MLKINFWTKLSIDYANQRSYLDDLFQVYPTIPDGIREIDIGAWNEVEKAFEANDNNLLINKLLKLKLFPIKDSYIAYLKRDKTSINRNPATIARIAGRLYEMGLGEIYTKCSEPKETNRQIGPFFKRWLNKGSLGIKPIKINEFLSNKQNAILDATDSEMMNFAKKNFGYNVNKGIDFIARFNNKYVIGEAKFLTDFGGHQNAQFNDAISLIDAEVKNVIKIAILDGVLFIKGKNKMHKILTEEMGDKNIMSALVLREFLYQL